MAKRRDNVAMQSFDHPTRDRIGAGPRSTHGTRIRRTLIIVLALLATAVSAAAQQAPKKPARRAPPPAAPPPLVLAPAAGEQLAAAALTYYGDYACEFKQTLQVSLNPRVGGYVDVRFGKQLHTMKPVLSSTGAVRLEDVRGRVLLVQIAQKSMLLDVQVGRRLVDECVHETQAENRKAMAAAPPVPGLGIAPDSTPDPVPAAASAAAASAPIATPSAPPLDAAPTSPPAPVPAAASAAASVPAAAPSASAPVPTAPSAPVEPASGATR